MKLSTTNDQQIEATQLQGLDEHERLNMMVKANDRELHEAWLALVEAPALQAPVIRKEVEEAAMRATRGVRLELRESLRETLQDEALIVLGCAFTVGVLLGLRR